MEYEKIRSWPYVILPPIFAMALFSGACRSEPPAQTGVRSYLSGRLSVSAEVDTIPDYRDFELVVVNRTEAELDTIGYAVTDSTGGFAMEVAAPDAGVYPLIITRRGTVLKVGDLVVAAGDTATLNAVFPMGESRPLIVRSRENAAWMAFKNTRTLHSRNLFALSRQENPDQQALARSIAQTIGILWGMQENYGNTLGADLAAVQSIIMLEGLNDSLLLARARTIDPRRAGYLEAARAARRAQARMRGLDASIDLLDEFVGKTRDREDQAELRTEYVQAYLDFNQVEKAEKAAQDLATRFPDSPWADWARRALYDFNHLLPGMPAPELHLATREGDRFRLADLKGQLVLLEFYTPEDPVYQEELDLRNALLQATTGAPVSVVSVSMNPDTLLNEAFAEGRVFPGIHVIIPDTTRAGRDITRRFNLFSLPRRFLIGPDGLLINKYDGRAMASIQEEVAALLNANRPVS